MDLGVLTPILLLGGIMAIVVGANFAFRWTNRRFPAESDLSDAAAELEDRVLELEERLDSAERDLTDVRTRLAPPRDGAR